MGKALNMHPDSPEATPEQPVAEEQASSLRPRACSHLPVSGLSADNPFSRRPPDKALNCTPDPNNPLLKSPSMGAALRRGHVHSPKL